MTRWWPSVVALALCPLACAPTVGKTEKPAVAAPAPKRGEAPAPKRLAAGDLLSGPPDVEVVLHPPAIVRDRVYGPLLKRASALAAAYAGPHTLGTTALAAIERTEEVDVAMDDAGDALVLLRGVPAELDVMQVVDENGLPVWRPAVGDVRQSFAEYESTRGTAASLFVLPQRTWVVASGVARTKTRDALVEAPGGVSFADGEPSLAKLSIRGGALVRRDERLRMGSLAPLGSSLLRASFELTSGAEGVIVGRLEYASPGAATDAAQTAQDVVGAFRRKLEQLDKLDKKGGAPSGHAAAPPLAWLGAAGVDRENATVNVRAPIPKAWLDVIAAADVSPESGATPSPGPGDVPWGLWRRTAPGATLSSPGQSSQGSRPSSVGP